jgi:hypothetical protein
MRIEGEQGTLGAQVSGTGGAAGAPPNPAQLFECELGNLSRVFNSQPANRNDLLGDKLRDGVIAIL